MQTFRIFTHDCRIKYAGTDHPSFFNSLWSAISAANFEAGDMVYQVNSHTHVRMWEVMCLATTDEEQAAKLQSSLPEV